MVLTVSGLPASGAIAFGLAEAGCGFAFAGRGRRGGSGQRHGSRRQGLGDRRCRALSFLLRGVGDSGGSHGLTWLTWLSPIGWAELVRPFAAERWWVLALPVMALVAGLVAAFALAARRDQGAGLMQPGPGPATAGRLLSGPAGLSLAAAAWLGGGLERRASSLAAWRSGW